METKEQENLSINSKGKMVLMDFYDLKSCGFETKINKEHTIKSLQRELRKKRTWSSRLAFSLANQIHYKDKHNNGSYGKGTFKYDAKDLLKIEQEVISIKSQIAYSKEQPICKIVYKLNDRGGQLYSKDERMAKGCRH